MAKKLRWGICGVAGAFSLALPASVFAAQVLFDAPHESVGMCGTFVVQAALRPDGESLNAIEGGMAYPAGLLDIVDIRDADSGVSFWVERPAERTPGIVNFSGIAPGGFVRNQEALFSVVFQAQEPGRGVIEGSGIHVLKNDGLGSSAAVSVPSRPVTVVGNADGCAPPGDTRASASSTAYVPDTEPPESFPLSISRSADLFGGAWFLVFGTQDKGSGIDHYTVREGRHSNVTSEGPYLLQDQSLHSDITVTAVDRAGNERVATIPQEKRIPWWYAALGSIGILFIISIILFVRRK